MAWTSPRTWVTGELVTAAILNSAVRDNFSALRSGGVAIASQAANDVLYASSSTQLARLAAGTSGQFLKTLGSGSAPAWAAVTFASVSPLTTRGDVLVATSGATTGTRLAKGTANQVLTSDGTDVAWANAAGGGFPFLDKATLTSGELQTGTISLAGSGLLAVWQNVECDTDGVSLRLIINGATSGYDNVQRLSRQDGGHGYGADPSDALYVDANIATHGTLGNATGEQSSGHVYLCSDGTYLNWHGLVFEQNANGDPSVIQVAGSKNLGGAITSVTLKSSSGNIDGGEMIVYNVSES